MNQATSSPTAIASPRPADPPPSELSGSRMKHSRILGGLFLAGFLVYGSGSSVVASLVHGPDFLNTIAPLQTLLALGAFLMLLNTAVDIAKAVLFFPILERHSKRTALTYFAALITQVVFLSIGALAVLMLVPLSERAGEPGAATLGTILVELNGMAYQVGQMTLGVGAIFLCALLFKTRLVPRWLAVSGLIGYTSHVAGTIAELFGVEIGLYLTMPGFFFELALPLWLLIKGFQREAFEGRNPVLATA
ncbi:hypothetical protein QF038_001963 [Pseudarthrobacter sp. W1I19]|uniref:DUF4386 domain-containing protein n=1 Tax=Pseudarthrobacter sp. W1I19 TaxID=3042288 RepID=UPI002783A935|nr:DUF4386 domain-containing protein [Pseudarthrobacter sp. W1I19]MDQ0923455.1 hypothetical protein [Pseudarthrobacter sp. W1I19]